MIDKINIHLRFSDYLEHVISFVIVYSTGLYLFILRADIFTSVIFLSVAVFVAVCVTSLVQ